MTTQVYLLPPAPPEVKFVLNALANEFPIRDDHNIIDDARWDAILENCFSDWMRANAAKILPRIDVR